MGSRSSDPTSTGAMQPSAPRRSAGRGRGAAGPRRHALAISGSRAAIAGKPAEMQEPRFLLHELYAFYREPAEGSELIRQCRGTAPERHVEDRLRRCRRERPRHLVMIVPAWARTARHRAARHVAQIIEQFAGHLPRIDRGSSRTGPRRAWRGRHQRRRASRPRRDRNWSRSNRRHRVAKAGAAATITAKAR